MNPATSPTQLHRLARHRNIAVRRAVAANPNTSRDDLVSLTLVMPDIVGANSVLEWWLLEDANWLTTIDDRARHRLLAAPSLAEGTRWWAARFGTSDDKSALLMSEHTNVDVLDYIGASDGDFAELIRNHVSADAVDNDGARAGIAVAMNELVVDADEARDVLAHGSPAGWVLEVLDLSSTDLRRAVAAHRATTPSLLARLLLDDDERTVHLADRNPHALDLIRDLKLSPRDLAQRIRSNDPNLLIEHLQAVRESPEGLRCLASHPSSTDDMIAELCCDASWVVRQVAARSSRLTLEQLERLAVDDDRDVRAAAAANPALPVAILRAMQRDRDELVRTEADEAALTRIDEAVIPLSADEIDLRMTTGRASVAAVYPDLPIVVQTTLAASPDWRVRHRLASNPSVSARVLDSLADDEDVDVRREVAQNPRTSLKSRRALCVDESPEIRAIAVARIDDSKALRAALNDADADVRRQVAANPAASVAMIRALANDTSVDVRVEIARRAILPVDVEMRLAADAVDDVRGEVVRRPTVAASALEIACTPYVAAPLDDDESPFVPELATSALSPADCRAVFQELGSVSHIKLQEGDHAVRVERLLDSVPWIANAIVDLPSIDAATQSLLAKSNDWRVRERLARRSDADEEVLRILTKDSDYDTRAAVAANPNTPDDCLPVLARDGHRNTRLNVLERPTISEEILDILALDEDEELRELAGQKSHYRPAVVDVLSALTNEDSVDQGVLDSLLDFAFVRKLAASHPHTTPQQLQRLATDQMWEVRELVAANPNTTTDTLEALANDLDRDVRRGVAGNPNTPKGTVAVLQSDGDRSVARAASSNLSQLRSDNVVPRALLDALRSRSVATRILALSCHIVPERELRRRRHYMSIDWRERLAVAKHPNVSPAVRRALASDGLRVVRNAVSGGAE